MFEIIYKFFSRGLSPMALFTITATVTYVFFITLVVCMLDRGVRRAKKNFFVWLCFLAGVLSAACYALDYLTAKTFPLFQAVLWYTGQCALFLVEYGVLAVQSVMFVGDRRAENEVLNTVRCAVPPTGATNKNIITPVKRTKTGGVQEISFGRPSRIRMENPVSADCLGERYVKDCIERLKNADLTDEDSAVLRAAERLLTPPIACKTAEDKRRVSEANGELIALMAKYF